jgi:hypothetical protein
MAISKDDKIVEIAIKLCEEHATRQHRDYLGHKPMMPRDALACMMFKDAFYRGLQIGLEEAKRLQFSEKVEQYSTAQEENSR